MIEESRSIVLSDSELLVALAPLLEEAGVSDSEIPTAISFRHDDLGEVVIELDYDVRDARLAFDHMEAGRAILHHCIAQRIPLPRGSHKELALRGDQLALIVRITTGDD